MTECCSVTDVSQLLDIFDASTVHRLTTDRVIRRGEQYRDSGAVVITALSTTTVTADVQGTHRYEVRLDASGDPDWRCSCPAAVDGDFCKHCVAVAAELAMIAAGRTEPPLVLPASAQPARTPSSGSAAGTHDRRTEQQRIVEYLRELPTDRLVDLVVEQADGNWKLREQLLLAADDESDRPVDIETWIRRIDDAMFVDDYVGGRAADAWASNIFFVLDALDDLLGSGYAAAVILLAEHAFRSVERAVGYIDDSNTGCLRDISERAGDLHFRACELRPPDPVALARSLIDLELNSELEGLYQAVNGYADLLGDVGLAEYGRLLKCLGSGSDRSDRGYTVKSMRRAYASALNDIDALIAELGKDPAPGDVVTIMDALVGAGRVDEAIKAGRAGIERLRSQRYPMSQVIDALAALLTQRGDVIGAIELRRDAFEDAPTLSTLQRLVDAVGVERDDTLDKSIDHVRKRVSARPAGKQAINNDVLVEMLMWAERHDDAWDAARAGGCNPRRWMELAAGRERDHPIDAIDVYEPQVIRSIEAKNNAAYAAAVDLMKRVRRLADTAGVPERFEALLVLARTDHKPKRNLQKLLNQQGW